MHKVDEDLIEILSKQYNLSNTTVEYLVDMYGEQLVEPYILSAINALDIDYTEADLISACEEIAESAKNKVSHEEGLSAENDLNDADQILIKRVNTAMAYFIIILLTLIGCALLSVILHINFKYLISFCVIFALLYGTVELLRHMKAMK